MELRYRQGSCVLSLVTSKLLEVIGRFPMVACSVHPARDEIGFLRLRTFARQTPAFAKHAGKVCSQIVHRMTEGHTAAKLKSRMILMTVFHFDIQFEEGFKTEDEVLALLQLDDLQSRNLEVGFI